MLDNTRLFYLFALLISTANAYSNQCPKNIGLNIFNEKKLQLKEIAVKTYNHDFKCPKWILSKKDLNKCPKVQKGQFKTLPETFDKALITFSNNINKKSIIEAIIKRVKKDKKKIPVFAADFENKEEIINNLRSLYPSINWSNHIYTSYHNNHFPRDSFQTRIDEFGNNSMIRTRSKNFKNPYSDFFKKCKFAQLENSKDSSSFGTHSFGGNFLTLTPKINITTAITTTHDKAGYTDSNTIKFPAGHSAVDHIDEMIQPLSIKYNKRGCPQITALISSPRKALEILKKKKTDDYFFDMPYRRDEKILSGSYDIGPNVEKHNIALKNSNMSPQTKRYLTLSSSINTGYDAKNNKYIFEKATWKNIPKEKLSKETGMIDKVKVMQEICKNQRLIPKDKNIDYKITEFDLKFGYKNPYKYHYKTLKHGYTEEQKIKATQKCKKHKSCKIFKVKSLTKKNNIKYCENLSSKEVYQVLNNQLLGDSTSLQKDLDHLKVNIQKKLKQEYPHCKNKVDWIESPVIPHKKIWAMPNMTNSMPISNGVVSIPEPYSIPFKKYMNKELKKRNISPIWTDTLHLNNPDNDYNILPGNVHCATNSIPICQPREKQ